MQIIFSEAEPHFLGLDASIWLNAAGILVGLGIAGLLTPWLASRSTRRDQQERTLRLMLNTWQIPANPDYQHAMAVIPLDFRRCRAVLAAHDRLLDAVNAPEATSEEDARSKNEQITDCQHRLMEAMADEIGLHLPAAKLRDSAYLSRGFLDREMLLIEAMRAWSRIADALERNNKLFEATISQADVVSEDGKGS